jgi:uncharacterized protein YdaU (DUF1376 family)
MTIYYYQFNIGDYRKDTVHLSLLEHGIYRQLIDTYYTKEGKLEADMDNLMRTHSIRNAGRSASVLKNVIRDFFVERDGMLTHRGCDKVMAGIYEKSDKAKASARARWDKEKCERNADRKANAMRTVCYPITIEPITNNHKPIKKLLAPEGVSLEVWDSFLQQRQKTRAVVTETVIKTIQKKADLAGWPLERALSEIVARGWRGFKAEWVKDKQEDKLLTFAERDEQLPSVRSGKR